MLYGVVSKQVENLSAVRAIAIMTLMALFAGCGAVLVYFGLELARLGGSWYYSAAGVWLLVTTGLLWRKERGVYWSFSGLLLFTLAWALWESGVDPWALIPRLVGPTLAGGALLVCTGSNWPGNSGKGRSAAKLSVATCVIAFLVCFAWRDGGELGAPEGEPKMPDSVGDEPVSWQYFGGTAGGLRHVASAQINVTNVSDLELAWSYRISGDSTAETSGLATAESTPIEVNGKLFFCTSTNLAIALDSTSGEELWRFDPQVALDPATHKVCRGVAYHGQDTAGQSCSDRLLMGTVDNRLLALDTESGTPCPDFGDGGYVNLNEGLGVVPPGYNYVTSPPTILNDTVIVGSFVFDNQSTDEPPGVVRGFDVRSGELRWAWDVLQEHSAPPLQDGETYPRNTPNVWSVASVDEELGLVYLPTGNTPPDFFGGHRSPEQDRYGSSVVALDVETGDVRWHFQTVTHDIWDYDIASQPVAVQWNIAGEKVPALLVPTKRGEIFVLDRATGEPLTTVEERPVPQGPEPGEWLAETQPFSAGMPSFAPPPLEERSMWGATLLDQLWCRIEFRRARYEGLFTPQSSQGSIVFPGAFGVMNWGSVSVDPERDLIIANTSYLPWYQQLIPRDRADELGIHPWGTSDSQPVRPKGQEIFYAQAGTPYAIDSRPFLSPLGFPCNEPPWGELVAIDMADTDIAWRVPLGTTRDVAPLSLSLPTGIFNIGGSVTTMGGLTFIAATADNFIRAFNTETGQELWKTRLPAGGQANPISYVSKEGRQYVVIAAGGHIPMETKAGDFVLAYALPQGE